MRLWIIATLVAFYVKGVCGFANTLVFNSIIGFAANNIDITPVELVLGFPSNIILTWKNRKSLDPKVFVPLCIMVLAGCIPGAFLLKNVNAKYIKIAFGVLIILLGIEMYFREKSKAQIKESKILLGVVGVMSGILCGIFGVGALLAAYVGRVAKSSDAFKANICAVFTSENIFRVILYSAMGVINLTSLKQTLILVPFMLIGLFAGIKSSQFLDEKVIKKLVILLLILSGIMLIIKNL